MTTVTIDAGTLTASKEDRTITGLLVPYGEECRSNLGRFSFDAGAVTIPSDLGGMSLNVEHARENVVGHFSTALETPAGIVATFKVAATAAGDKALDDAAAGRRKHLSAEVAGVKIKDGKGVAGSLFAAALVAAPAFPSATLLAAAVDTEDEAPAESSTPVTTTDKRTEVRTDENGVETKYTITTTTTVDGDTTTIKTTEVIEAPDETPNPEDEEPTVATATAPATLTATAPGTSSKDSPLDSTALFSMISNAIKTQDPTLMAALSDVKVSGAGAVGTNTAVPQYVGELWSGRGFARKVIPLLQSAPLTSFEIRGWRWGVKPEVAEWSGNKAAIPSNSPTTTPYTVGLTRFAGGWDLAREFSDFGQTEVLDSFVRAMIDSYAKKSDEKVLADLLAAATSLPVGTIPTGVGVGIAKIVRGGLRVIANDATPSFALVAPDVFESVAFTRDNEGLKFLSMSLGLEEGSTEGFKVVPHTGLAAGSVLVGAKEAATTLELPSAPIRVSAIDIARGGLDEAVHGYIATKIDYPAGLQLVTNAV